MLGATDLLLHTLMVQPGGRLHQAVINVQGKTRATRKQMNDSAIAIQVDVQRCNLPNSVGNFTRGTCLALNIDNSLVEQSTRLNQQSY